MEQNLLHERTKQPKCFRGWLALGLVCVAFVTGAYWAMPDPRYMPPLDKNYLQGLKQIGKNINDAELVNFVWEQQIDTVPQVGGRKFSYTFYSSVDYVGKECGSGQMWHCQDFPGTPWGSDHNGPPQGAVGALISLGGSGGRNWDQLDGMQLGEKLTDTGYGGVDLDWETDLDAFSGNQIVAEMDRMRASYPNLKIVITIMGSFASTDHKREWDVIKALHENNNLDYVGLMMYGAGMVGSGAGDWGHKNTPTFIKSTLDYANGLGIPMAKIFLALTTAGCDDEFVKIFAGFIVHYKLAGSAWWQGNGLPSEEWLQMLGQSEHTPPEPTPTPTPTPPRPPVGECAYTVKCDSANAWYARFTIEPSVSSAESTQGSYTKEWRLDTGSWYLEPEQAITDEPLTLKMQPDNAVCEIPSPTKKCR